jgi:hypothetical protein
MIFACAANTAFRMKRTHDILHRSDDQTEAAGQRATASSGPDQG